MNLDRCVEVAGDDLSGRFLRKLFRWYGYTKVVFDGQKWVTMTRAQWEGELSCTQKQFRRVLEKLSRGEVPVIVKERHRYKGLVTLYLRPSDETYLAMMKGQSEVAQKGQTGMAQKGHSYIENPSSKPEKGTKIATGSAVASPETICLPGKIGYPGEVGNVIAFPNGQGGPDMLKTTGAEVAAKFTAAKPKPINMLKPDKAASLMAVWKASLKAGQAAPAHTQKVQGQLNYLIKTWPAGQAPAIVAFVLQHWFEMTEAAETHAGAFKSPSSPEIGYLVKFQHIAMNLWLKSKMKPAPSPKPAPKPKVVQPIAQPEPAKKFVTMEEILAMEAAEEAAKLKDAS